MEGPSNLKPSKRQKRDPIKFCSILSVMLGATSFLVVVEASQTSQASSVNVILPTSVATGASTKRKFQARMTVNETYEPDYSNSSSALFKEFAAEFEQKVGDFLNETLFGFDRVEVKKLASGSVIVDFDIVVLKSSNATVNVIVQALETGNGSELGYTILGSVSVNAADQQSTSSIPSPTATDTAPLSSQPMTLPIAIATSSTPTSVHSNSTASATAVVSDNTKVLVASSVNVILPTSVAPGASTNRKFQARMTVNETYESDYSNASSAAFQKFAAEFEQKVGDFLNRTLFGFDHVEVTSLANGSVIVDFDIVVLKSSNATVNVIVEALEAGNGAELGYTILGSVSVNAADQQSTSSIPSPTATVTVSMSPGPVLTPSRSPPGSLSVSASESPSHSPPLPSASPAGPGPGSPLPPASPPTPPSSSPPPLPFSSVSSIPSVSTSPSTVSSSPESLPVSTLPTAPSTPSVSLTSLPPSQPPLAATSQSTSTSPSPLLSLSSSTAPSQSISPSPSTSQSTSELPSPSPPPSLPTSPPQSTIALPSPSQSPSPSLPTSPPPPPASSTSSPSSFPSSSLSAPVPSKTRQSTTPSTEGSKEFKGSGSIDNEWDSAYANSNTPEYKRLSRNLKSHLTAVLKKAYEDNFIGVEVANFQEGSIKFDFTVYLKATTSVDEKTLKDVIQKGEGSSNFTITGVSVEQIAGPKPTTSTTEKPEAESGLEKWEIVLIVTLPVIVILVIALLVVMHQNRRLSSMHKRDFPVSDYSRSVHVAPRMYSTSSNMKEMYQLTGPGTENAGSRISRGLTTFNPDNEDINGTSNTGFVKMEGDKSERDNQSLDGSKSDASDKDSVHHSPGEGFI